MNNSDSTQEVKRSANIVEEILNFVALKKVSESNWKGRCPFHEERSGSFFVNSKKNIYKCFGCGNSGDVFTFLQKMTGQSFPDVKNKLAEKYNIPLNSIDFTPEQKAQYDQKQRYYSILDCAAGFYQSQLNHKADFAKQYALGRGLSEDCLEKFRIGYSPDKWNGLLNHLTKQFHFKSEEIFEAGLAIAKEEENGNIRYYDRFRNRLMFPVWDDQGRVIAFGGRTLDPNEDAKYINSPEGVMFSKGKVLYAWHLARKEIIEKEYIILAEGYMDAISLHEAGYETTVAIQGTSLTESNVVAIDRMNPRIVYLCLDGDSAGMRAVLRAAKLFSAYHLNVRVIALPNKEDPDSFLTTHGAEAFQEQMEKAPSLAQYRMECALSDYDLTDPAERQQGVIAAGTALSDVVSNLEKMGYITWLAEYLAQIDNNLSASNIRRIEDSLWRDLRIGRPSYENRQPVVNNVPRSKGVVAAEEYLINTMLLQPGTRRDIFDTLPVDYWLPGTHREIVEVLADNTGDEEEDMELISSFLSEEANEELERLLFIESPFNKETSIDGWIQKVKEHNEQIKKTSLVNTIKEKLQKGEEVSSEDLALLSK